MVLQYLWTLWLLTQKHWHTDHHITYMAAFRIDAKHSVWIQQWNVKHIKHSMFFSFCRISISSTFQNFNCQNRRLSECINWFRCSFKAQTTVYTEARGRGDKGDMSPPKLPRWTAWNMWHSIKFSAYFSCFGGFAPRPQDLADDVTHSFVPSKTNSWLRTCVYRHRYRHNVITTQT